MQYEEFIAIVSERSGLFEGGAVALTRATLVTLAERITGGEARDLAAQLPGPLQDTLLANKEEAEAFSFDDFVRRVAERSRHGSDLSDSDVIAVMETLRDTVTPGEFDDVLSQLPKEFHRLSAR
jgi:uncharacterized protein (DUF2267 family)